MNKFGIDTDLAQYLTDSFYFANQHFFDKKEHFNQAFKDICVIAYNKICQSIPKKLSPLKIFSYQILSKLSKLINDTICRNDIQTMKIILNILESTKFFLHLTQLLKQQKTGTEVIQENHPEYLKSIKNKSHVIIKLFFAGFEETPENHCYNYYAQTLVKCDVHKAVVNLYLKTYNFITATACCNLLKYIYEAEKKSSITFCNENCFNKLLYLIEKELFGHYVFYVSLLRHVLMGQNGQCIIARKYYRKLLTILNEIIKKFASKSFIIEADRRRTLDDSVVCMGTIFFDVMRNVNHFTHYINKNSLVFMNTISKCVYKYSKDDMIEQILSNSISTIALLYKMPQNSENNNLNNTTIQNISTLFIHLYLKNIYKKYVTKECFSGKLLHDCLTIFALNYEIIGKNIKSHKKLIRIIFDILINSNYCLKIREMSFFTVTNITCCIPNLGDKLFHWYLNTYQLCKCLTHIFPHWINTRPKFSEAKFMYCIEIMYYLSVVDKVFIKQAKKNKLDLSLQQYSKLKLCSQDCKKHIKHIINQIRQSN